MKLKLKNRFGTFLICSALMMSGIPSAWAQGLFGIGKKSPPSQSGSSSNASSAQDSQATRAGLETIKEKLNAAIQKLDSAEASDRTAAVNDLKECGAKLDEMIKLLGDPKDAAAKGQSTPAPAPQGLFGLGKGIPGMGGPPLSLEQLNGDLDGGMNFFKNAYVKFSQALLPAEKAQEIKAKLEAAGPNDRAAALGVLKECGTQVEDVIKARNEKQAAFTEEENKLIGEGRVEVGKGIAKWTAIGAAIALTAMNKPEAAVAAAIPSIMMLINDLPFIIKTSDTVDKLDEMNKGKKG